MEGELQLSKGRAFQMVGAATAKLQEPKHLRTRGTEWSTCKAQAKTSLL